MLAILLFSSIRTFRELERQKEVYLRSRAAAIAARLETLPASAELDDEPGLENLAVLDRTSAPELEALWQGRELFRTETSEGVFRAWIPFHRADGLHIARIDLARESADFLVEHARHNILIATLGGLALVALSLLTNYNAGRAARAEQRQLEMEHLAALGKMSAVLAHEIRNPLGTIKGFAQLLAERGDPDLVAPILAETSRLEDLVKDLLLYGRPPEPALRAVNSAEIAAMMESHARHGIGGRAVEYESQVEAVAFDTDPAMLEQALLNLLRNAVEAAGEKGRVGLRISADSRWVRFTFSDSGSGFSEEARARLFEPFFTTKASGTGLGLSITRKLAQALGGELTISSEGGTKAVIRIPRQGMRTNGSDSGS